MNRPYRIVLLPGDGIGPEVLRAAVTILRVAAGRFGFEVETSEWAIGGCAVDELGEPFPIGTETACLAADAVLMGAVGGPKWDNEPASKRPERGLLQLRKALGTFANLRPSFVPEALAHASPLRAERVRGVDLLVVRELTGGIYFGEPRGQSEVEGFNTMRYSRDEVVRIARVAFTWARRRRGSVTSVDKANVLDASRLWRKVVTEVHQNEFADLELSHMYVDNAAMQLVRAPERFDVLLTGNLFGDILSDLSATLPGSLGMLPSASVGGPVGVFEPVHGSAPDIAGQGIANPVGAVLSMAMMLDALGHASAAEAVRRATYDALNAGLLTPDLAPHGDGLPTQALVDGIAERLTNSVPAA